MKDIVIFLLATIAGNCLFSQNYSAGFKSIRLTDSTRMYKPNTGETDPLHYRFIDLDIWYPSKKIADIALLFEDLFELLEERANMYQTETDYSGLTEELAQLYVAELGIGIDGRNLLDIKTNTHENIESSNEIHPIVLYISGFNGMGFENFKILESLAQHGFIVASISSIGRYPGDMSNKKEDMMEQVWDAEFALNHILNNNLFKVDTLNIGILGCSWGGLGGAVLSNRIPEIKAMVSLDGSETHYFGNDINDPLLSEIHNSQLLKSEKQGFVYLYFESDNKLDEFTPTSKYSFYEKLHSDKFYLRFINSRHEDYLVFPSLLNSSDLSKQVYEEVTSLTTSFFKTYLKGEDIFVQVWQDQKNSDRVTDVPPSISGNSAVESVFLEGKVTDRETNEPLQFVNIGILNREVGTVSDSEGNFSLELDKSFTLNTIRLSMIGYIPLELIVKDVIGKSSPVMIEMEEKTEELEEVVVVDKALKRKKIGNTTQSKFLSTGFGYEQLGAEMGIKVKVRKPTLVDSFNFHISYNRLNSEAIFRLNICTVKKGKPNQNVLKDNVLIKVDPKQTGLQTIDLTGYNVTLTEDALVTLEWVDFVGEESKDEAIYFSLALFGNSTYIKKTSQANFRKHSSLGIGFYLDVYR